VEAFSAHVADMVFRPIRVVAELVMFVEQPLLPSRVLAQLAFVDARIVAVVLLVQNC